MANYTIIGGDGKEYGPITGPDLRKWAAEGRLSAQSLAKAENDAEFRPLSAFPEFADVFGTAAPTSGVAPMLGTDREERNVALEKVKVPAIGLMVSAIISLIMSLWSLIQLTFSTVNIQQIDAQLAQLNNPQLQQFMDKMLHFFYGPFGIVN